MFPKRVITTLAGAVLLLGSLGQSAHADHALKKNVEGVVVAIIVSALAKAAASAANASKDSDAYRYNHGLSASANAAAACIHRAHRAVKRAGGRHLRLEKISRIGDAGDGEYKVVVEVTGVYPWGKKRTVVNCVVDHDRVKTYFTS